jgi:hypothetical protein
MFRQLPYNNPANRAGTYKINVSRSTESVIANFSIASGTSAQ